MTDHRSSPPITDPTTLATSLIQIHLRALQIQIAEGLGKDYPVFALRLVDCIEKAIVAVNVGLEGIETERENSA